MVTMSRFKALMSLEPGELYSNKRTSVLDAVLLVLMVIALSVQGQALFSFGGMDFTIGHALVGLVGFAMVLRLVVSRVKPIFPSAPINILFIAFVVITIIDTPEHGFGSLILKYLFQYLVLLVSLNLLALMDGKCSEQLVMLGAWIVLGIVLLNAMVNYEAFVKYYANPWDGHPKYSTIFSGGANLEATWPALLGAFCHNDWRGRIYLALVFCFAEAVQSRAGLMLAACVIIYVVLIKDGFKPTFGKILTVVLVGVLAAFLIIAGPRAIGAATRSAQETTVQDAASSVVMGRIGIWSYATEAFMESPLFGYGAGNAMDAIRSVAHFYYWEDNVHNYPLQVLLDFGLVGFLIFAFIVVRFLIANAKHHFCNSYSAFIVLYLIGGMVQFVGGELFVGFALAGVVAFGASMMRNQKSENIESLKQHSSDAGNANPSKA